MTPTTKPLIVSYITPYGRLTALAAYTPGWGAQNTMPEYFNVVGAHQSVSDFYIEVRTDMGHQSLPFYGKPAPVIIDLPFDNYPIWYPLS